jgi:hypothetical protein
MAMMKNEYSFSPQERLYFERALQAFNSSVAAGIQMLCTQQELAGQWRLKLDGSGIERCDPPTLNPPPAADPAPLSPPNGLAS